MDRDGELLTYAAVITAVENSDETDQNKKDYKSAVFRFALDFLNADLDDPVDEATVYEKLQEITPAMAGMKSAALSNRKRRVRKAMALAGVHIPPGKYTNVLSGEWAKAAVLIQQRKWDSIALSRFLHFLSVHSFSPVEIHLAIEKYRCTVSLQSYRQTCKTWNRACSLPGWPGGPVADAVVLRRKYGHSESEFGELGKLIDDHFRTQLTPTYFPTPDEIGTGARPPRRLRPGTVKQRRIQLGQYLSALRETGLDFSTVSSFEQVLQPELVQQGLNFIRMRSSEEMPVQIGAIGAALRDVARRWCPHILPTLKLQLEGTTRPRRMSSKVRNRLRQFDDRANMDKILLLPDRLRNLAKEKLSTAPLEAAKRHEEAVLLSLLLNSFNRLGQLVRIGLHKHFKKVGKLVYLEFPGEEVKNGEAQEFLVPPELFSIVQEHVAIYRKHLPGCASDWLFPGKFGDHQSVNTMGLRLTRTIFRHTGLSMHTHLFRHLAALIHQDDDPGEVDTIWQALGHQSSQTLLHYMRPRTMKPAAVIARKISGLTAGARRSQRSSRIHGVKRMKCSKHRMTERE